MRACKTQLVLWLPVSHIYCPPSRVQYHHLIHHALLMMGLVRGLLVWRHPSLVKGREALADGLSCPSSKAVKEHITSWQTSNAMIDGNMDFLRGTLLPMLVGVIDNCTEIAPKSGHLAVSLLSLIISHRLV